MCRTLLRRCPPAFQALYLGILKVLRITASSWLSDSRRRITPIGLTSLPRYSIGCHFFLSRMTSVPANACSGVAPVFSSMSGRTCKIGRAHVCTPVTIAHLVCRLLLVKKNKQVTHQAQNQNT